MVWQGECRVDYTCYIWYTVLCRVHLFAIFCVSYLVVYQFWFVIFNELIPYESMVVLLPMYVLTFPYICFCWVYLFSNLKHFCYWVRVRPCILMCVSTHLRIFVLADFVSCCILVLVVCVFFSISIFLADSCFAASLQFVRRFIFLSLRFTNTLFAFCLWSALLVLSFWITDHIVCCFLLAIYVHMCLWNISLHYLCRRV